VNKVWKLREKFKGSEKEGNMNFENDIQNVRQSRQKNLF
jgi:hypothetical protein